MLLMPLVLISKISKDVGFSMDVYPGTILFAVKCFLYYKESMYNYPNIYFKILMASFIECL